MSFWEGFSCQEFAEIVCEILETEIKDAFDSLLSFLVQSKKILRRKQEGLNHLSQLARMGIKIDVKNLEAMCARMVFEEPYCDSNSTHFPSDMSPHIRELLLQQIVLSFKIQSMKVRNQAFQHYFELFSDTSFNTSKSGSDIQLFQESKRLKYLTECTCELQKHSPIPPKFNLEEEIDNERRGMPSRKELSHLNSLLEESNLH